MKTEDLIAQLAADPEAAPASTLERGVAVAVLAGGVVTVALFWLLLGPRPELGAAMRQPVVLAKTVLPLLLGLLALILSLRAARPGVEGGWLAQAIWLVPAAALGLFLSAYVETAPGQRLTDFIGHSIPVCLPSVVILSLPLQAGLLRALARGAPVHPRFSGFLAGLAASGLACAVYSTFCVEDTPLFYAFWYALAILIGSALGALTGPRVLRW